MHIKVDHLSFGYSKHDAVLDDICFESVANSTIAIVGASGSGKSTLLRLMCGIIQKNTDNDLKGDILIDGQSPALYTKMGYVGFMFQEPTLFPNLTVQENIELPLKFSGQKDPVRVNDIMQTVGLEKFANYLPSKLSGGMKTRTALARTFITRPKLILLDEPFSSLDIRWKFFLYQELEKLKEMYTASTIIVTHDIAEALLLSNHIIVLGLSGKILNQIFIDKPLPRAFDLNSSQQFVAEFAEIQNLIMRD